jgi:hypothetical protein
VSFTTIVSTLVITARPLKSTTSSPIFTSIVSYKTSSNLNQDAHHQRPHLVAAGGWVVSSRLQATPSPPHLGAGICIQPSSKKATPPLAHRRAKGRPSPRDLLSTISQPHLLAIQLYHHIADAITLQQHIIINLLTRQLQALQQLILLRLFIRPLFLLDLIAYAMGQFTVVSEGLCCKSKSSEPFCCFVPNVT